MNDFRCVMCPSRAKFTLHTPNSEKFVSQAQTFVLPNLQSTAVILFAGFCYDNKLVLLERQRAYEARTKNCHTFPTLFITRSNYSQVVCVTVSTSCPYKLRGRVRDHYLLYHAVSPKFWNFAKNLEEEFAQTKVQHTKNFQQTPPASKCNRSASTNEKTEF